MESFKLNENFEPSRQLKKWWRYTHKTTNPVSGTLVIPGLFQTTWYVPHFVIVIVIFGLEFWAFNKGLDEGMDSDWVLAAIIIDVFFAIGSHLPQSTICEIKNRVFVEKDQHRLLKYGKMLRNARIWQWFFWLLIVCSAIVKIYFVNETGADFSVLLPVCIAYSFAAILHIAATGYFLFGTIHKLWSILQHNRFSDNTGRFSHNDTPEEYLIGSVELIEAEQNKHKVKKKEDGNYYFFTKGLMTDSELSALIVRQKTENQKRIVAEKGVECQLQMLINEPNNNEKIR
jgi:hypothetical protein